MNGYIIRIHDIWSKTSSSKWRLVECDIWSIGRFVDKDLWSNKTIGGKFAEIRQIFVESRLDMSKHILLHAFFDYARELFRP